MRRCVILLALALACGHNSGTGQNTAPVPHILAPADGDEVRAASPVTLKGSAIDKQDGALHGASLHWSSNLQGELGTGEELSVSLRAGTHWLLLTATDSGGLSATAQITVYARNAPNQPPAPAIDAPADGASFDQGKPITLKGHATDPEDGTLPGSSLSWTSSLDGALGTGTTVIIPAASVGTHRILLTATDRQGLSAYTAISITVVPPGVNHAPVAAIASPADGASFVEGAVVSFTGSGTDPEDGPLPAASLSWSSNLDGALGTGASLQISTLKRGLHWITLTAKDSAGAMGSAQIFISIAQAGNHAPVAAITSPADGAAVFEGTTVNFAGSATDAEDGALGGASLAWASSLNGPLGTGSTLSVSNLFVGAHTILLTATDSRGDVGTAQISLTILAPNHAPVVTLTSPADGARFDAGQIVQLRGSASDAEDGALTGASLSWTSSLDGLIGHGASLDTQSLRAGAHTLSLTAIDSGGRSGSASVGITVKPAATNLPPVARLQIPLQALVGETLIVDGSTSSDSDGSIASYRFGFGDGMPDATGPGASVTHAWAAAGTYTVTLTITDDKGATGTASATLHVSDVTRIPGVIDEGPDLLGSTCSLAIAPSGAVVIAYRDITHPSLRLATVSGQGATIERVDGLGYEVGGAIDTQLALALAPDGTPHVAYAMQTGALWYATRTGGGWLRERVDTQAARYDDAASHVAIVLKGSEPLVAYLSAGQDTVMATRSASSWTDTVLAGTAFFYGGLAIDASGKAVFSMYDAGWRIGTWSGATSFTESDIIPGVTASYHDPVPVAVDPSGRAVASFQSAVTVGTKASPYEAAGSSHAALFVDGAGSPWVAYLHTGNLEIATALDGTYWRRTSLGPVDDAHPSIAVDAAGNARACFFRSGKLMLY